MRLLPATARSHVDSAVRALSQRNGVLQQSRPLHVDLTAHLILKTLLKAKEKVGVVRRQLAQLQDDAAESSHVRLN